MNKMKNVSVTNLHTDNINLCNLLGNRGTKFLNADLLLVRNDKMTWRGVIPAAKDAFI